MIDRERQILALHIKTALATKSGMVLYEWLKDNCFMTEPTSLEFIESNNVAQRINARRDLWIALENLLQEGLHHVTDTDE